MLNSSKSAFCVLVQQGSVCVVAGKNAGPSQARFQPACASEELRSLKAFRGDPVKSLATLELR